MPYVIYLVSIYYINEKYKNQLKLNEVFSYQRKLEYSNKINIFIQKEALLEETKKQMKMKNLSKNI